jgi:hypothetical protein
MPLYTGATRRFALAGVAKIGKKTARQERGGPLRGSHSFARAGLIRLRRGCLLSLFQNPMVFPQALGNNGLKPAVSRKSKGAVPKLKF